MFTPDMGASRALPPALSRRTELHAGVKFPEPPGAVAAIGRRLNALTQEYNRLDEASLKTAWDTPAKEAIEARMDVVYDEAWELREQALELPARTLSDCAVKAAVIGEFADLWNGSVFTDEREVKCDLAAIRRAAASVVMALADLGGLNLDQIASGDLRACCERQMREARQ